LIRSDCCQAPRSVQGINGAKGLEESPRQLSLGLQVYKAQMGCIAGSHKLLNKLAQCKGVGGDS